MPNLRYMYGRNYMVLFSELAGELTGDYFAGA